MAEEVRLPKLGRTMQDATIINCLVKVGDEVKKGDCVFEIETDKATLEMESPADGFVKHILAEVDQTIPVGTPLLILGGKNEQVSKSFLDSLKTADTTAAAQIPAAVPTNTGTSAKITEADIVEALPVNAAEIKLGGTIPLTKKQRLTAERMLESKRQIPCFYLTVKADVTELVELRTKLNENAPSAGGTKISYNDFIIRAVAISLQKFPIMTGQLAADSIKLPRTINVGLAVSTPNGLIVPVVKDVQEKNLKQIATATKKLVEKAQNEKLLLTDLEGACITISNLGALGMDSFIPIVIPGQCSILGIGRITDTCTPENGNVTIRKLMNMTLSVDHKVANGAYAAQFLDFARKFLEDAGSLV